LQLAFRAAGEPSPRAALWSIRLEAANLRLTAPDEAASVSAVALDCGFTHLGRFAIAYRARFGETPSATLRRALRAA
jgi:transcriptional regulator GlxA family with amidase domain